MEIGCQSSCGLFLGSRGDIYIFFIDPSLETYQTVSMVYSLKKDGKERGAKNGEIMHDKLDFWAN